MASREDANNARKAFGRRSRETRETGSSQGDGTASGPTSSRDVSQLPCTQTRTRPPMPPQLRIRGSGSGSVRISQRSPNESNGHTLPLGGNNWPTYQIAEQLRMFMASSNNQDSPVSEGGQHPDTGFAQSLRHKSGFESGGYKTAGSTATVSEKITVQLSDSKILETANRAVAGDEKVAQQLQDSVRFQYLLPGLRSAVGSTRSGEESETSGKNDTGYESEDLTQRLLNTPVSAKEDSSIANSNGDAMPTAPDHANSESVLPCFNATFDKEGGMVTSGSISLIVPPFSVSEATQFSTHIVLEPTGIPVLTMPDNHYPLSPILSLAPHDAVFQQKVTIRFPSSAVPRDWLLRLLYCPLNGDRWEALVDVLLPHDMFDSSVIIMSRDATLYDPSTNSIFVDHLCYKCWVGVPSRPNAKKQILCALFGRPLGASWEVIVRCFSPYTEVYRSIFNMMQDYGAEPLVEGPEILDIEKNGNIRIRFEHSNSPWQLDGGSPEFLVPAKPTFWDTERPLGCRHKFVIKPEKNTDYVRAVISISYINDKKRELQSITLDGSAPDRSPRASMTNSNSVGPSYTVFNITHCSDLAIGSNSQLIHRRGTAPVSHSAPLALPSVSHDLSDDTDTTRLEEGEGCQCSHDIVSQSDSVDKANSKFTAMPSSPTIARCQPNVTECGQQEGVLFVAFPQEQGKHAPHRCTITYLGQRDVTIIKSSEGTRTTDPFVVQTWKPRWPHPDIVTLLIKNEEDHIVGCCCLSLGASTLPVVFSVTVMPYMTGPSGRHELTKEAVGSFGDSRLHEDEPSNEFEAGKALPNSSGLHLPSSLRPMSSETGKKLLLAYKHKALSDNKVVEMARDYVYAPKEVVHTANKDRSNSPNQGSKGARQKNKVARENTERRLQQERKSTSTEDSKSRGPPPIPTCYKVSVENGRSSEGSTDHSVLMSDTVSASTLGSATSKSSSNSDRKVPPRPPTRKCPPWPLHQRSTTTQKTNENGSGWCRRPEHGCSAHSN